MTTSSMRRIGIYDREKENKAAKPEMKARRQGIRVKGVQRGIWTITGARRSTSVRCERAERPRDEDIVREVVQREAIDRRRLHDA